ncbi:hypothetical protein TrCOL_g829, partial [Triparma columacea]
MTLEQAAEMDMKANRKFRNNKRRLVDQTMEENRAAMDEAIPTEEPLTTLPPNTKKEFKNAKLAFLIDLIEIMESRPQKETTPNGNTTTDPSFSNILLTLTGEIKKDDELLKQWQNNFDELVDKACKEEKVFRMACLSHIDSGEDEKDTRNAKFDEAIKQISSRLKRSIAEKKNDRKKKNFKSTTNAFVTSYDIDSDEGKEIY